MFYHKCRSDIINHSNTSHEYIVWNTAGTIQLRSTFGVSNLNFRLLLKICIMHYWMSLYFSFGFASNNIRSKTSYTPKLDPQPQLSSAFGLKNLNPPPISSSEKSNSKPYKYNIDFASTTHFNFSPGYSSIASSS